MSRVAEVARWGYKNPGIWSNTQITEATGLPKATVQNVMLTLSSIEPQVFHRVNAGVYHIRPPEFTEHEKQPDPAPVNGNGHRPAQVTFEELLPDDVDLYPPFKIQIYDHWRAKNGDKWYRVRDEHGKRAIFHYVEDDDY